MLSAESASGTNILKCIRTMHEIIVEVEQSQEKYYKINLNMSFWAAPASIAAAQVWRSSWMHKW